MVRVVPIVVEGGRIIENRGEETNQIKVKYEETFTEDFGKKQENKTWYDKKEKTLDKLQGQKTENGRTIPIPISEEYSSKVG